MPSDILGQDSATNFSIKIMMMAKCVLFLWLTRQFQFVHGVRGLGWIKTMGVHIGKDSERIRLQ